MTKVGLLVVAVAAHLSVIHGDCVYDGTTYINGASFLDSEGCNTCYCNDDHIACTEKLCVSPEVNVQEPPQVPEDEVMLDFCTYNGKEYREGESFKDKNDCNTCLCRGGFIECTEMFCEPLA
ncbi:kielin/chordin-like protein [Corticium candelabrum]|uniref:kielin/chordin-like protein n=1 Tax=Corticium candelabrum TaxID=121492 RepID=UPI002E26F725|nr:kielin/chordin-like protein [Corticium candelabrum]